MRSDKLGTVQISGLIVGAILGSGIILLPPFAYEALGEWSVIAWCIIMTFGVVFAMLFAKLALAFPGSEGVPIAVRNAFGPATSQLTSIYLISAVCIGPVAVLMTAAETITISATLQTEYAPVITAGILIACCAILLNRITVVGTIALAGSLAIGFVLTAGSIASLLTMPASPIPTAPVEPTTMGQTLLLLFWAIIGWEILGNYSEEVRTPQSTIPKATILSTAAISFIYIIVGWALYAVCAAQPQDSLPQVSVTMIVEPLLGKYASSVVMLITTTLCCCTYLMIVGGVSRLIAELAESGRLPAPLARKTSKNVPAAAILTLFCLHICSIALLHFHIITLEQIVEQANVFFLANSFIAILAGMKLLPSFKIRAACCGLCIGFLALLAFSSIWALGVLVTISVLSIRLSTRKKQTSPMVEEC